MDQQDFGFSGAEPTATPVTVNMKFVTESVLDGVWIAYLELPYKNILAFSESGDATVLGKALGFVTLPWCGGTNEWDCFVMRDDHLHIVWQEGDMIYRSCLGRYKYMEGEDSELDFAIMLDQVMEGVPLITSLVIEPRDAKPQSKD